MNGSIRKLTAVILILAISCLPMAAYAVPDLSDAADIGVIGSADGPTAILVTERRDMDPPLWQQWGFESLEEMMEMYEMESEDEYYELVAMELDWMLSYEQRLEAELVERGGTAGIINVMVNGDFAAFGAAVPEQTGGTTYAPVKSLFTGVGYDAATRTVTAKYLDTAISLTIGKTELSISKGGVDKTADLDFAPYLKNGSTYIPVRAVFEALGCEVFWDSYYKTVVIIDKAAVIAEIDRDFTTLNKLMTMRSAAPSGASMTTMDAAADVTMFDTINGDKKAKATVSATYLYDEKNISMSASYDAASLIDMLFEELFGYGELPEGEISPALKSSKLDMIMDMASGVMYLKTPIYGEIDPELPADAWVKLETADMFGDPAGSLGDVLGGLTAGELIYERSYSYYTYYYQINIYNEISSAAKSLAAVLGDGNFKQESNNYTLTVNAEKGAAIANMLVPYISAGSVDVNLVIKTDGSAITAVSGNFKVGARQYGTSMLITGKIDANASGTDLELEVHVKNSVKVQLSLTSKTTAYTGEIPKAPPAGDKVVPSDETIFESVITNM